MLHEAYGTAVREIEKSRNKNLRELFESGFAMHHAGMLRSDRNLVERLFAQGTLILHQLTDRYTNDSIADFLPTQNTTNSAQRLDRRY